MSNKKKIIIIIVAVILAAVITVTALIIFKPFDKPVPIKVVTKESADNLKNQAIQELKNNDSEQAKKLLQEAKKQYEEVKDTEGISNSDYQLYLIENPTPQVVQ